MLALGTTIDDRFCVEKLIANHGMTSVYRAVDTDGTVIALKVQGSLRTTDIERARREAGYLAGLDHPAIVRYLHNGEFADGKRYLAEDWLEGPTVADHIRNRGFTVAQSLALLQRIAEGLAHAHDAGLIHRDIKPSNLILHHGRVEDVKIIDFGIALNAHFADERLTGTGEAVGSVPYMAPEALNHSGFDQRSDIFALGCVLYECLTGQQAFYGRDAVAIQARILLTHPAPLRLTIPELPDSIERLVARMLAKSPEDRPASCHELVDELARLRENRLPSRRANTYSDTAASATTTNAGLPAQRALDFTMQTYRFVILSILPGLPSEPTQDQSGDDTDVHTRMQSRLTTVGENFDYRVCILQNHTIVAYGGDASIAVGARRQARCALALKELLGEAAVYLLCCEPLDGKPSPENTSGDPLTEVIDIGARNLVSSFTADIFGYSGADQQGADCEVGLPKAPCGRVRVEDKLAQYLDSEFTLYKDKWGTCLKAET